MFKWLLMFASLAIASCATSTVVHDTAPDIIPPGEATLPNGSGGINKIGEPYRIAGQWYTPMQNEGTYDETGIASWYGKKFHGLRTANGEIYDMHALSAAHKTLPLPSLMRVTNLENGKSIIVRVNDRGPFVKSRLIDLSYAAAHALGYANKGTTHVRVQSLEITPSSRQETLALGVALQAHAQSNTISVSSPDPLSKTDPLKKNKPLAASPTATNIFIQLGAFGLQSNASQLQHKLKTQFSTAQTVATPRAEQTLYRVRIGPFSDMLKVEKTILSLQKQGFQKPMVVIQ